MTGLLEKATSEKRLAGSEGIKNEEMQGKHVPGRGKSHGKGSRAWVQLIRSWGWAHSWITESKGKSRKKEGLGAVSR